MKLKAELSHVHWSQVLSTGILVVILLEILGVLLYFLTVHLAHQMYVGSVYLMGFLLIVGGGVWVARKVERAAPLHGLLVGLVVALTGLLLSLVFNHSFGSSTLVVLGEFALAVAAGWLGGVLGSRVRGRI